MSKTFKIITSVFFILVIAGSVYFVFYKNKKLIATNVGSDIVSQDTTYSSLKISNPLFSQGVEAYSKGNYEEALTLLRKSEEKATTDKEKSVVEFNIASTHFYINRAAGIDDFITLSKNEKYENRIRALAMLHAYLMYAKYDDESLLGRLSVAYDISWTGKKQVINEYMKKMYDLYPLAFPAIIKVKHDISPLTNKDQALAVYEPYIKIINVDIDKMKQNIGEATEVTSTMLARTDLLSILSSKFTAIPKEDVEKAYEDLVKYDQEKGNTVNRQYVLLGYANFESGIKDYDKATQIMTLLLSESLNPALIESLSKTNLTDKYIHFSDLAKNTTNTKIVEFINSIGKKLNK